MTASAGTDVLVGLVVAGAMLGALTLAAVLAWRSLRRRWRLLAAHSAVRTASLLWDASGALFQRRPSEPTRAEVAGWSPQRSRREMQRAVEAAESAVRGAADAGAPVGELPELCRRLRTGSDDLQRLLAAAAGGLRPPRSGGSALQPQVAEVLAASSSIRLAALTSAGEATGPRLSLLADDADREVRCLSAGVASARASVPHPGM